VHGRCGELAALSALRDMFGIREAPDISPAHLRPAVPVPSETDLSERNVAPASGHASSGTWASSASR
jgi:hypothetical protein